MSRPRSLDILRVALGALVLAAGVAAAPGHGETTRVTLTGEVLDLACYLAHGGRGESHAKCALKCAEQGQPIGLLGGDGTVYVLLADHADLTAYNKARTLAGQQVVIEGETVSRDGLTGLTVLAARKK